MLCKYPPPWFRQENIIIGLVLQLRVGWEKKKTTPSDLLCFIIWPQILSAHGVKIEYFTLFIEKAPVYENELRRNSIPELPLSPTSHLPLIPYFCYFSMSSWSLLNTEVLIKLRSKGSRCYSSREPETWIPGNKELLNFQEQRERQYGLNLKEVGEMG